MPRVPVYNESRVGPAQLPDAQVAAPTVQGGNGLQSMARGLSQAGGAMGEIAMMRAKRANEARINEAATDAARKQTELITEATQRHGKDALELPDNQSLSEFYGQQMDDKLQEIRDSLSSPYQRDKFSEIASRTKLQLDDKLTRHTIAEQANYEKAQRSAAIDLANSRAVLFRADPQIMAQSTAVIQQAIKQELLDNGMWSDENIRKSAMRDALSPMYKDAITGLIDGGQLGMAQQYLQTYGQFMEGSAIRDVNEVLTAAQQQAAASAQARQLQINAQRLLSEHDGNLFHALTATDDPNLRDAIEDMYNDAQARQDQLQDAAFKQALRYIDAGQDVPPSVRAHLGSEEVDKLLDKAVSWDRDVTNWRKWATFTALPEKDKAEMSQRELYMQYGQYFDKKDWRDAMDMWQKAKQPDETGGKEYTTWTKSQLINDAILRLGLSGDDGKVSPEEELRISKFRHRLERAVQASGATSQQDLQTVIDGFISNTVTLDQSGIMPWNWGNTKQVPEASLTEDTAGNAYVEVQGHKVAWAAIPDDYKQQARQRVRDHGGQPTAQIIATMYMLDGSPE